LKDNFATSLLYFWVKGELELDEHFLKIGLRNTILWGLIPAGANKSSIPLDNISSVNSHASYDLKKIIIGVIAFLIGFMFIFDGSFLLGLFLVIAGVNIFDSGILTVLAVNLHTGTQVLSVPLFEKKRLNAFKEGIEEAIKRNMDSRNVAKATEAQTEARNKATEEQTEALKQDAAKQTELLTSIAESLANKDK